jgi:predicted RND superfamily exporter protein
MDREGSVGRLVFIFPNFDTTRTDRFMQFVEEIRQTQCTDCREPFFSSGESTVFYEIVKLLFHESRYVVLFTVGMIILALWFNFKSLKLTFLVMSPLFIGLAATVGWMGLLNIPFNIINIAAIPIILGTADDYGVHLFQRFIDDKSHSLRHSYEVSFRPILGAAITTLIGFGSLGFADMGGVRSFGLLCFVGILMCTITTLIWFPAFIQWVMKAKK